MDRSYKPLILEHFIKNDQMLFLAGPRQVGKTTLAKSLSSEYQNFHYFNFDIQADRELILQGSQAISQKIQLHDISAQKPFVVFDELHKYTHWKNFLKGFFDAFQSKIHILVTGSAKLNIFQKGGDSLMGRYLLYRMHPFSIAELRNQTLSNDLINQPKNINMETIEQLLKFGGFPNPYIKHNNRFLNQWHRLRRQQLFKEDIRSLKQIQDIPHIEKLAMLLQTQAGQQIQYSNLAKALRVATDTVIRWINVLEEFYYCFRIQPYYKNIKRSLIKEPKIFLWDWSEIKDHGQKLENMVACHLHKAIHLWTDHGFGEFKLHYCRDKEKREVDFLVTRDEIPWFIVEVKTTDQTLSKNLIYFHEQTKAKHAFQVVLNKPHIQADCFAHKNPVITPLSTLLSQLI